MNRALFLDRDGTVIEDRGYTRDPAEDPARIIAAFESFLAEVPGANRVSY